MIVKALSIVAICIVGGFVWFGIVVIALVLT